MINAGSIGMPLHSLGKVPTFLTERMGTMGESIVESIVDNYGKSEVLTRLSDPNWFQALVVLSWECTGTVQALQPLFSVG